MFKLEAYCNLDTHVFRVCDTRSYERFRCSISANGDVSITKNDMPYLSSKDNKVVRARKELRLRGIEAFCSDLFVAIGMLEEDTK